MVRIARGCHNRVGGGLLGESSVGRCVQRAELSFRLCLDAEKGYLLGKSSPDHELRRFGPSWLAYQRLSQIWLE